ncbi:hypothetical protein C8Z91_12645 [Paenibacillus elgii]|uniref:Uncharacterized protein n=1 Tax=Paenibacillus elgii TaxID=189691 RepID=A0A2T6G422_9BACL|nr:hypothetical protein [Paenibacillus elgii]PUA38914.1 hypothetical protein C8Z91_12645 [Paenibacillus elgii]
MRVNIRQWAILALFSVYGCLSALWPYSAYAESGQADRSLLQKGLTIYEIDQELSRIADQEIKLQAQMQSAEQQIREAEHSTSEAKIHAAKVVRSYYMGDRDSLWVLLFSVGSFSDAVSVLDYLQMILRNDKQALQRHTDAWQRLTSVKKELADAHTSLQRTKERYLQQRERLAALQKEVDAQLADSKEQAALLQQMLELNKLWENKGIPLFKTYFQALAGAMQQLPELVTSGGGKNKNGNLVMNGVNYTFQMTDSELNDFLRKKNDRFRNLTFHFYPDQVSASGQEGDIAVMIRGSYEMAVMDDGSEKPFIRFRILEMQFNGFSLPSTTVEEFEKSFDLGIYPQNIASFLQVTSVRLEEGKLSILLKLAL